jgi:hypothetical protein
MGKKDQESDGPRWLVMYQLHRYGGTYEQVCRDEASRDALMGYLTAEGFHEVRFMPLPSNKRRKRP